MFRGKWQHSIICMIWEELRNSVSIPTAAVTQGMQLFSKYVKVKSTKQGPEWASPDWASPWSEELSTYKWQCAEREKSHSWGRKSVRFSYQNINFPVSAAKVGSMCDTFEWIYGGVCKWRKPLRCEDEMNMGKENCKCSLKGCEVVFSKKNPHRSFPSLMLFLLRWNLEERSPGCSLSLQYFFCCVFILSSLSWTSF